MPRRTDGRAPRGPDIIQPAQRPKTPMPSADSAIDYAALRAGDIVSDRSCRLDAGLVGRYTDAVGDRSPLAGSEIVPPMALAALSVRGVVQDLRIPGGTVHLGQEVEFASPVRVGEEVSCRARLSNSSVRSGMRILVVGLSVDAADGRTVMTGKSTISVPA